MTEHLRERMDGLALVATLNRQRITRPILGVNVGECAAYTPYIPTIQKPAGWGAKFVQLFPQKPFSVVTAEMAKTRRFITSVFN